MIEICPLAGIGEVCPGDDIGDMVSAALRATELLPCANDILVVTQKIVSKAEGRFADLASVVPGAEAMRLSEITGKDARLVELILSESVAVVRAVPNVLITRHRCGYVMANAGIDRSNVGTQGRERVLLLPVDADLSASKIRKRLGTHFETAPAIVISDSFGRPWRNGVVNVAIGANGLPALVDKRGHRDRDGRSLEVTQIALADMAATAAGLAMGEANESVPAALLRGLAWSGDECPASALVRPVAEDLFQ